VRGQHIHSDEISSSRKFKSGSIYDGFNADMILDLVATPPNGYATASCGKIRSLSGLSVDNNKEYWSNMFSVCNYLPNGNHSAVQSIFYAILLSKITPRSNEDELSFVHEDLNPL